MRLKNVIQFDENDMKTVHYDLFLKADNSLNTPSINSIVIVYVSNNYTVIRSLTVNAIIWYIPVHYFSAVQSK